MQSRGTSRLDEKLNKKTCRYLICIGRPTFLTFFDLLFDAIFPYVLCFYQQKSTLPYLWQGAFSFCSLTLSVIVNDRHERLLPSNIGLFSNDMESTSVTT